MNASELLQLYFGRENALQGYWTIYVVIAAGLLAFASMRKQPDLVTTILVTVLFCFFTYKNLGAIVDVTQQQLAMLDLIKQVPAVGEAAESVQQVLNPVLKPTAIDHVRWFHTVSDVLVVAALWAMELRRRRATDLAAG